MGNGTLSTFSITFPTFENENITAEVFDETLEETTDLDLTTHFTLANIGKPGVNASFTLVNGAFDWVTVTGKLKTGYTLFIKFNPSAAQPMKGRDWGQFAPEKFERTLDRLAMSIKAVKSIADQAVTVQLGSGGIGVLPSLTGNALKMLQVNATEDGLEYGESAATIEGYATTASNAATAAEGYKNTATTKASESAVSAAAALASQNAAAISNAGAATQAGNAATSALSAAASQDAAATSAISAEAAKNVAITKAGEAAASAAAAAGAAAAQAAAEAARDLAVLARNAAQTAKTAAELAETNAETAEANAELAETNAEAAAVDAADAATLSELFADESEQSASQSELFANLSLYAHKLTITVADSPFQIDDDLHDDTLIIVDDSGGDVDITMCPVSDTFDQELFKVGFMKKAVTGNSFTVSADAGDTIGGVASVTVDDAYMGLVAYPGAPTNWQSKFFIYAIAADGFVLSGAFQNYGDPGVDGTWRTGVVAGVFKIQQRQAGVWVDADAINPPA